MQVSLNRFSRLTALLLAVALPARPAAGGPIATEYELKAAFVFNFIRFVQWPDPAPGEPVTVAVVGNEVVVRTVRRSLDGRSVGDRPIRVVRASTPEEAARADIMYVTGASEEAARRFVSAARGRPVLTVTECHRFQRVGSLVNFFVADDTVRFAVNATLLEKSPLKLSSQMLQYAAIVRTDG